MKEVTLNNGVQMPMAGIGTFLLAPDEAEASVLSALQCGCRLIDTANAYLNEKAVGRAIKKSGVNRKDIFPETKLWPSFYEQADAVDKTLRRLGTDYIDLLLLHQPFSDVYGSWHALEKLYKDGVVRAIGVSNFFPYRLADLIAFNEIAPMVNQIETNPFNQQVDAHAYMAEHGVVQEAWAPFGEGKSGMFTNPTLVAIGERHGKSPAQVILRWLMQRDIVALPKSTHKERMAQNIDIFDFTLTDDDMASIAALDTRTSLFFDHATPAAVERMATLVKERAGRE